MARLVNNAGVTIFEGEIEGGSDSPVLTTRVPVSSAELLALDGSTEVELLAPDAERQVLLLGALTQYVYGGTPYTGTDQLHIGMTGGAVPAFLLPEGFLGAVDPPGGGWLNYGTPNPTLEGQFSTFHGAGLALNNYGDQVADGNGTLVIDVFYSLLDLVS